MKKKIINAEERKRIIMKQWEKSSGKKITAMISKHWKKMGEEKTEKMVKYAEKWF